MEYRVLGPIEVVHDGQPIAIAAGKQRELLCCLLVAANRAVPLDLLVDQLWGERPPASATKNVQVLVSPLRKSLGVTGARPIGTVTGGYVLRLQPGDVDVDVFEELLARGRGEPAAGRPHEAELPLAGALALWRGRPYDDARQRSERRAEALEVYDGTRRRTSAELGIAPGESLRTLHVTLLEDGEDGASPGEPAAGAGGDDARALAGQ